MDNRQRPPTVAPRPIQIELPADLEATYANFALITHSPSEMIIDFARVLPNQPKAKIYTRIVMTPMVLLMFLIGLFPAVLTDRLEPTAREIISVSAPGPAREASPAAGTKTLMEEVTHGLQHSGR